VLAQLARTLADARVNIVSLAASATSGRGKIRLIVNDPGKAKRALRRAKYRVSEEPVFLVRLRNKPGALARVAGRLAKARVNIRSAYATTAGRALRLCSPSERRESAQDLALANSSQEARRGRG